MDFETFLNPDKRLGFIKNEILKANISVNFKYISFLSYLVESEQISQDSQYSVFKNILLYSASIIEAVLHHTLATLIKKGKIEASNVMPKIEKYSNRKTLFKTSDGLEICGVHFKKEPQRLSNSINFIEINRACKRAKILDKTAFEKVEQLREKRNRIHLSGLSKVDDFYEEKDIKEALKLIVEILELSEEKMAA